MYINKYNYTILLFFLVSFDNDGKRACIIINFNNKIKIMIICVLYALLFFSGFTLGKCFSVVCVSYYLYIIYINTIIVTSKNIIIKASDNEILFN